jgi:hypothetical protein
MCWPNRQMRRISWGLIIDLHAAEGRCDVHSTAWKRANLSKSLGFLERTEGLLRSRVPPAPNGTCVKFGKRGLVWIQQPMQPLGLLEGGPLKTPAGLATSSDWSDATPKAWSVQQRVCRYNRGTGRPLVQPKSSPHYTSQLESPVGDVTLATYWAALFCRSFLHKTLRVLNHLRFCRSLWQSQGKTHRQRWNTHLIIPSLDQGPE